MTRKIVALVFLVVAFGAAFGASPIKNRLEVCHLLEGTQDDLATHNSSDAEVENWKEDFGNKILNLGSFLLNEAPPPPGYVFSHGYVISYRPYGDVFLTVSGLLSTTGSYKSMCENGTMFDCRLYPSNSTAGGFIRGYNRLHPSNSTAGGFIRGYNRLHPSNSTAGGFIRGFVPVTNYIGYYNNMSYPPSLRLLIVAQSEKPTFQVPLRDDQYISFLGVLFVHLRRHLKGYLNFATFRCIVSFASAILTVTCLISIYLAYVFYRDRMSECEVLVQATGCEQVWMSWLQRSHPDKQMTFELNRRSGAFHVICKVVGTRVTVTYRVISQKSYKDALMHLVLRFPKNSSDFEAQGILRAIGMEETVPIRFLKSVVFFAYAFWRSRNVTDRVVAVTQWLDTLLDLSYERGVDVRLSNLYSFFSELSIVKRHSHRTYSEDDGSSISISVDRDGEPHSDLDDLTSRPDDHDDLAFSDDDREQYGYFPRSSSQPQGIAECADQLASFFKGVFNSSSIRACFRLIALIWHFMFVFKDGKIDWDHLTKWDSVMFKNLPEQGMNIGTTLLEQVTNLATSSWEFYQTKDYRVFLRNDNEVSLYLEAVESITAEIKKIPIEPALHHSIQDVERRVKELIVKGEALRPRVKLAVKPAFTSGLLQLRSLALDLSTMARASSTRHAPFTLLINGTPKIGKSSITALIFKQFQLTNPFHTIMNTGIVLPDGGIYTRTLKEEYWSCYMNSFWGILYDDLGQTNPKVPEFALEINEIIQVVNNVMYYPTMAALEDKGKRFVAPHIVLATSNNKDLNAHHAVRSPGAVLRRFPFVITPTVRPEFCTAGTLDSDKVREGDFDLWTFQIEEVVITNGGRGVTYNTLQNGISTAQLLNWVDSESLNFYRNQAKGDGYLKKVAKATKCPGCSLMSCFCTCFGGKYKDPTVVSLDSKPVPMAHTSKKRHEILPDLVESSDDEGDSEITKVRRRKPKKKVTWDNPNVGVEAIDIKKQSFWFQVYNFVRLWLFLFGFWWLFIQWAMFVFYSCMTLDVMISQPLKNFAMKIYATMGFKANDPHIIEINDGRDTQRFSARNAFIHSILTVRKFFRWEEKDLLVLSWLCGWYRLSAFVRFNTLKAKEFTYRNPRTIAVILTALSVGAFAVWYANYTSTWRTSAAQRQGGDVPAGQKPPPPDSDVENVWKSSNKLAFSAFLTTQSKTGDPEWFKSAVRNATAHLQFDSVETTIIAVNVFGSYWLIPKHFTKIHTFAEAKMVSLVRASGLTTNMGSFVGAFDQSMLLLSPDSDHALIKLSTPPGPNLLPYVVVPALGSRWSAVNYFMRCDGVSEIPAEPIQFGKGEIVSVAKAADMPLNHIFSYGRYSTNFITRNGDCGSPCISIERGRLALLATHVAADAVTGEEKSACVLPLAWLQKIQKEDISCVVQGSLDLERPGKMPLEVDDDVHKKCPLRFEGLGDLPTGNSAIPIGAIKGVALNRFCTKVSQNLFAPFWIAAGYVTTKMRPVLSKMGVPSWTPKRMFLLNACQHKDLIPNCVLDKCADHYFNTVKSKVPVESVRKCCIIDEETNLYGADGHNFISHMRFDTGAGFPHNKPKFEVLERIQHDKFPDGTCAIPASMKAKILRMEEDASNGVRMNIVFNSSLKDEPISEKKLRQGRIRVFQAISIEGLFLLRKYFLSILALLQTWNFASEIAVGMDASGPDWDDLHEHLFQKDWKIFCGDYSNYDQRMGSSIMLKAWNVVIKFAILSGNYPNIAIRIMWVLATECCFCVVNFFGDMMVLNGSNPSGHGLTVIINSICNSIYIRVAWFEIFGNLDFFNEHVRLMTYGDDNIISVHPSAQERFNQVTVTLALAKFGVVYTDAQKSGMEAKPFCESHEISFLKRGFVLYDGGYLSPLEVESIHKMLIIGVDECKVPTKDRLSSVLINSVMEAYQHGREFYDKHLELVQRCITEYDMQYWVAAKGGLPSFDSLQQKRRDKKSRLSSVMSWDC